MIQDMNGRVIRSRISRLLFSVENLMAFDVRTMNHCWIYWDIKENKFRSLCFEFELLTNYSAVVLR